MSFLLCSVLETWGGTGRVVDAGPASRQLDSGVQSLGCCAVNLPAMGKRAMSTLTRWEPVKAVVHLQCGQRDRGNGVYTLTCFK